MHYEPTVSDRREEIMNYALNRLCFLYYFSVYVNLSKIAYLYANRPEKGESGCKGMLFQRTRQTFKREFYGFNKRLEFTLM